MTEQQIELYKETKRRLRRIGIENPAEVIVALAEEIDHYRKKIKAMEEQIASKNETKHGDGTAIAQALRSKQSRDNRELLDRAAARIDELEAETESLKRLIVNIAKEEISVMTRVLKAFNESEGTK